MNALKRIFLLFPVIVASVLAPVRLYGQQEGSGPSPAPLKDQMSAAAPPVGQALVPEGVFASELVKSLKIGQAQDEAQAENMLSAVGIEPKNGWIAGYPVTPAIVGEIEKSVAAAADAGKLGMNRDQSLKAVGDLKSRLGLNVTPGGVSPSLAPEGKPRGPVIYDIVYKYTDKNGVVHFTNKYESVPKEYRDNLEIIREVIPSESSGGPAPESAEVQENNYPPNPSPEVINNYYYDEGPPVITYYAPPYPHDYLYAWVPYPFWSSGFFFSGFFILHDFHRHVFFHRHPFFVTNHISVNNRVFVVDPVTRSFHGGAVGSQISSSRVFSSPGIQSSARAIVGFSQNRPAFSPPSRMSNMGGPSPLASTGRMQRPTGQGAFTGRMSQPRGNSVPPQAVQQRRTFGLSARSFSTAPPRVFSPPPSQGRVFSAPAGRSSFRGGFSGHGGFLGGFHHGGGGFGGHVGGHR